MQELLITNIQRMSFHDGPGMRTTVFLKGCNLRCAWCHNPETQNPQPELIFRAQRCVRCGTCVHSCASGARTMGPEGPVRDTARCVGCGRCVGVCPMHLTPVYMNMYAAKNDLEGCEEYDVLDCIECGSCAYVCPARIPLVQQFRVAKMRVQEKRRAEAAAAKAAAENK